MSAGTGGRDGRVGSWHRRLLTPERAIELAGDCVLFVDVDPARGLPPAVRCGECRRAVATFGWRLNVSDLLAAVVRHQVIHHDLSLSGSEGADDERGTRRAAGSGGPGGAAPGGEPEPDARGRLDEAASGRRAAPGA